ncbi:hypothetical protein RPR_06695 [Rickettsia peacockii str. Rustic]|uniref:Uncharacterized protein n=1 Tax=Rickettsia peacockii (strain Rustic) TaxID=562019 RepID=C4K2M9_RICPU|nr:DUF1674 domain-containing protein [Rickettsia peacockii]ACR47826.1 hypothetical protein RPR_06695 [Rickettsia peacockii str. Rustic]
MDDKKDNRHLSKPAYREECTGDTERSTTAYMDIREDVMSTGSTSKLPLEAKFVKISNNISEKENLPKEKEIGGVKGLEPTRYGDWQHKGKVTDF